MNKKSKIILEHNSYVLAISYNDYRESIGGTDKVILSQKEKLYKNKISYLFIFPQVIRIKKKYVLVHMWEVIGDGRSFGIFSTEEIIEELQELSKEKCFYSISIHHLLNIYFKDLYRILDCFPVPVFFLIHDYYSICPQCFLLKNAKEFCGIDGYREEKCKTCYCYPKVEKHQKQMLDFLKRYEDKLSILVPSKSAKKIWTHNYPKWKEKVEIIPHVLTERIYLENRKPIDERIRIAFVGQQIYLKGWEVWKRVQKQCKEENGIDYYYFGHIKERLLNTNSIEVNFQREGRNAMLKALRENKIQVAILWSICPETFSFTYYECFVAGVFVITNQNSGNIEAMVRENKNGIVLRDEMELRRFLSNAKLLKEKIMDWVERDYNCPEILRENDVLFENRFLNQEKVERKDFYIEEKRQKMEKMKEKEYIVLLKKSMILFYKWIKKWVIKLFY